MAHEFFIKSEKGNNTACFFGYCNGVMYRAFNHPEANAGVSGDGSQHKLSKTEAMSSLQKAIAYFDISEYPDPTRIDDIRDFCYASFIFDPEDETYLIFFG